MTLLCLMYNNCRFLPAHPCSKLLSIHNVLLLPAFTHLFSSFCQLLNNSHSDLSCQSLSQATLLHSHNYPVFTDAHHTSCSALADRALWSLRYCSSTVKYHCHSLLVLSHTVLFKAALLSPRVKEGWISQATTQQRTSGSSDGHRDLLVPDENFEEAFAFTYETLTTLLGKQFWYLLTQ